MKRSFAIAAVALALAGCVSTPGQDGQHPDVAGIQAACAADALIRPSVSALLDVPGLATLEQKGAVMAARSIIDPICRDPAAAQQGAISGLTNATAQVLAVYVAMRQARAASAPG